MRARSLQPVWGPTQLVRAWRLKNWCLSSPTRSSRQPRNRRPFFEATDAEYDRETNQATEELQEIYDNGLDEEEVADRPTWEKVLPEEVESRFRDIDFSKYDISISSKPPTHISSPIVVVPLLPQTSGSPTLLAILVGHVSNFETEEVELFSLLNSLLMSSCIFFLILWNSVLMYPAFLIKGFGLYNELVFPLLCIIFHFIWSFSCVFLL